MQVTHSDDYITHAVIGGGKTIDFGISNNAEFFHILSSTLYTNQELAVVREVLCNAWDAHIEAGCTDKAVIVSTKDSKFSVQDFGHGIHKEKIGPIYGTYGASTKKNDGGQTGGFGLGCKAPFAYTDHFEVTSCHDGVKTVYSMSKSSAEVGGKPSIIPIASFPTVESGITVSLAFKQASDRYTFERYIKHITRNGEMKVELDGKLLEVHPFSSMTENFLVTTQLNQDHPSSERLYVRYGNVVYPIPDNGAYTSNYKYIEHYLKQLQQGYSSRYSIVFQAPAHSIGVTPSRESLSMQEHTLKTLQALLTAFVDRLNQVEKTQSVIVMKQSIEKTAAEGKTGLLLHASDAIPGLLKASNVAPQYILSSTELINAKVAYMYPQFNGFRYADIFNRVDAAMKAGVGDRGLLQSYRAALLKEKLSKYRESDWFHKQIAGPLLAAMSSAPEDKLAKSPVKKVPDVSVDRLLAYGHMHSIHSHSFRDGSASFKGLVVPLVQAKKLPLDQYLPYLRNIVVISHTKIGVKDALKNVSEFRAADNKPYGFLLYHVHRSKAKTEAAIEFFKKRRMVVIDITDQQQLESKETRAPVITRKKGLACASSALVADRVDLSLVMLNDVKRIEKPEWISKVSTSDYATNGGNFDKFSNEDTVAIVRLFGSVGGIYVSSLQKKNYTSNGAVHLVKYVHDKVCAEIMSNPRIKEHLSLKVSGAPHYWDSFCSSELLAKEFGLVTNITEQDRLYLQLYNSLLDKSYYNRTTYPELTKVMAYSAAIQVNTVAITLVDNLKAIDHYLDVRNFVSKLKSKSSTLAVKSKLLEILHLALKP
jgi:hypothetical protein